MTRWIKLNWVFAIGGIIMGPLSLWAVFMWLGLGLGFSSAEGFNKFLPPILFGSYPIFFLLCVRAARHREKSKHDYGFWDQLPILYFTAVFLITMIIEN